MARQDMAAGGIAINLGGDTTLANPSFGVWVGGAGNLKVDFADGESGVTLSGVPAGTLLPIQVSKIYSTANGTTATLIVALKG